MRLRRLSIPLLRNFVFGVEDSLVSTVGLLSGIAVAGVPSNTILLTGVVLIFVEAFSMAAGSLLSESAVENYEHKDEGVSSKSIVAGTAMFVSYFISGFIPLSAYIFWPVETAFGISIVFSVLALCALGVTGALISHASIAKSVLRMAAIGGMAIIVGTAAGALVPLL